MPYEGTFRQVRTSETQQARLVQLLGQARLSPAERGELKALGLTGTQAQDDQATAKLAAGKGKSKDRQATVADLPKLPNVLFDDDGDLL